MKNFDTWYSKIVVDEKSFDSAVYRQVAEMAWNAAKHEILREIKRYDRGDEEVVCFDITLLNKIKEI